MENMDKKHNCGYKALPASVLNTRQI